MNKKLLLAVFTLINAISVFSQWNQTLGPGGGLTTTLFAKGDTLFAGNFEHNTLNNTNPDAGTLYRSTNHAKRWSKDSTGFYGVPNAFTNNGNTVFVSTSTDGIFRSLNNGSTWSSLSGTNAFSPGKLLTVNGIIYVGSNTTKGVLKSSDNGNSFVNVSAGLPANSRVISMGAVGSTLFVGVIPFSGPGTDIYRSTNNGASWQAESNGISDPVVSSFTTNSIKLFAVAGGSIYYTTDLGNNWNLSNTFVYGRADQIISTGDTLYTSVFINDGVFFGWKIFRSFDNGSSWAESGPGIPPTEEPFTFVSIGKEIYAGLGAYGSVYKTLNAGATWLPANTGLPNVDVKTIFISGSNLFAGSLSNASVHISTNGGSVWKPKGNGLPYTIRLVKAFTQNANYLFAGMDNYGVYRSSDNGNNWESAANGLSTFGLYVNALTTKDSYVFAGTYDGVWRTSNNGNNWTLASPVAGSGHPQINTITTLGNYIFAGTPVNGAFRSADNGATWQSINNGISSFSPIYSIIVRGT
ncbi:MAG: hypothetical protein ABIO05_04365, partial [Ferruginibacter sp.]